jgi:hypothetical protein
MRELPSGFINYLDYEAARASSYGTFAEIGGDQEVHRWAASAR